MVVVNMVVLVAVAGALRRMLLNEFYTLALVLEGWRVKVLPATVLTLRGTGWSFAGNISNNYIFVRLDVKESR